MSGNPSTPPSGLAGIQAAFAASMRTPLVIGENSHAVQQGLYDQRLVADMASSRQLNGVDRLSVYNRQYWFRLLTLCQQELPLCRRRLGLTRFNRFCTAYLDRHPSRHPELHHLWLDLPAFCAAESGWGGDVLLEAAHLDRLHQQVFFAVDHVEFDGAALSDENLQTLLDRPLPFQAAWHRFDQRWNSVAAREMAVADRDAEGVLPAHPDPANWVIYRSRRGSPVCERLSPLQARLLDRLAAGEPLAAAIEQVAVAASVAEMNDLEQGLAAWFARWAGLGWFRAV